MLRSQIGISILGFFLANFGNAALWGSVSVEFWLYSAEIVRFLIVLLLFGTISLVLFKKVLNLNTTQFSETQLLRKNGQLIVTIVVLLTISIISIFAILSKFGIDKIAIAIGSSTLLSSFICNIFIYYQSK